MHLPPLLGSGQWFNGNPNLKIKIFFVLSTMGTLYWILTTSQFWLTILSTFYVSEMIIKHFFEVKIK